MLRGAQGGDRRRLVFHIGMPKCGSTYLQRLIFPNFPGIHYVKTGGQIGLGSVADRLRLLESIVASTAEKTILFSAESLCGHPADKASYSDFAEFLPHIVGSYDVTVIVVVRRQDSFIESMYRHHVRKGGTLDFDEFFSLTNEQQKVATKVSDGSMHHSYCDYARFLDYLERAQPGSSLKLTFVPFELMQSDLPAFVRRVADAVGVDGHYEIPNTFVNRGPSRPEFEIRKKLNKIMRMKAGPALVLYRKMLVLGLRASMRFAQVHYIPLVLMSDRERERIMSHYKSGNDRVARHDAEELAALGYC